MECKSLFELENTSAFFPKIDQNKQKILAQIIIWNQRICAVEKINEEISMPVNYIFWINDLWEKEKVDFAILEIETWRCFSER